MSTEYFIAFIAYFLVLLGIGIFSHKRQQSDKDFIVGNRQLNSWLTAFSAHASDMSGWLFMAFPAAVYVHGLSGAWIGIGLILGMLVNWQFIAIPLRTLTEKYEVYTLSCLFSAHFKDKSGLIRILTALMAIFFLTCYLSAGLIAMGYLLESLFQIDYFFGICVATLVAVTYTIIGGYYTVAKVDQFQAIFLMIMIALVPVSAFFAMGGHFETVIDEAKIRGLSLSLIPDTSWYSLLSILSLILGWGLGYFGQPHIITKFMGISSPKELVKAKYIGMSWQVITMTSAAACGLIGIGLFQGTLGNPELVFVEMVKSLFNPLIAGFILCAVIAASMSTMDSQILVCASIISEDFSKFIFKRHASPKELLFISRVGVIAVSAVALGFAFVRSSTVLDAVLYAWSGLGASFGPLIFATLYSKTANRSGAVAGIVIGGCTAALWPSINPLISSFELPSLIIGFPLSAVSIYTVSKLSKG